MAEITVIEVSSAPLQEKTVMEIKNTKTILYCKKGNSHLELQIFNSFYEESFLSPTGTYNLYYQLNNEDNLKKSDIQISFIKTEENMIIFKIYSEEDIIIPKESTIQVRLLPTECPMCYQEHFILAETCPKQIKTHNVCQSCSNQLNQQYFNTNSGCIYCGARANEPNVVNITFNTNHQQVEYFVTPLEQNNSCRQSFKDLSLLFVLFFSFNFLYFIFNWLFHKIDKKDHVHKLEINLTNAGCAVLGLFFVYLSCYAIHDI